MIWTASNKTISGAILDVPFAADDVGKGVTFRMSAGTTHWSRVLTYLSPSSVILRDHTSLPTSSGTIVELILLDLGETHNYQDYLDEIASRLQDTANKLHEVPDRQNALARAVYKYSRDKPQFVNARVAGNGTQEYLLSSALGGLWVYGYTFIEEIEYPVGNRPRTILARDEWEEVDDGTAQDGSNRLLSFPGLTPTSSQYFKVKLGIQMNLPEIGEQNFPNTEENFTNITALAASMCCRRMAAFYANTSESSMSADVVNYGGQTGKYLQMAAQFLEEYNMNVFGQPDAPSGVRPAFVDVDLDFPASDEGDYLFHSRGTR